MSAPVFVSYSRRDREYVERLAGHLTAGGLTVWFDAALTCGDRLGPVIGARIDECAAMIVVRTPAAARSAWVDRELAYAVARRRPLLPVLLEPCDEHVLLAGLQHEDVTGGRLPGPAFTERLRALVAAETYGGVLDATQVQVARLVAQGHSDHMICQRLALSRSTVRFHRGRVSAKLGAAGLRLVRET